MIKAKAPVAPAVNCPTCGLDWVVRFGKTQDGKQRYRCRNKKCETNTFQLLYTYYRCHENHIPTKPAAVLTAKPLTF